MFLEEILENKNFLLCGYGRTALELAYYYLGLNKGDEILYPGYICDVTVLPARKLGLNVKYYKLEDNLEPDFLSAERLITGKTKAFLAVNYFGFPGPLEKIKQFCARHGLYFIEDNAHSFLSRLNGICLESFGDVSITTFRKIIPLVNGAAVIINKESYDEDRFSLISQKAETLQQERFFFKRIKTKIQRFCIKNNINLYRLKSRSVKLPKFGSAEEEDLFYKIDSITKLVLEKFNLDKEAERRRSKYLKVLSTVDKDFIPIYRELAGGIVPLGCPFYVEKRDWWLKFLRKKAVRVYPWPNLPLWVAKNDQDTLNRYRRSIIFDL